MTYKEMIQRLDNAVEAIEGTAILECVADVITAEIRLLKRADAARSTKEARATAESWMTTAVEDFLNGERLDPQEVIESRQKYAIAWAIAELIRRGEDRAAREAPFAVNKLLTTHDVSKLLQVDSSSVAKWIDKGMMEAFRTPGGHRRVSAASLKAFCQAQKIPLPAGL